MPPKLLPEEALSTTDYIKPSGELIMLCSPKVLNFSIRLTFLPGYIAPLTVEAAFLPNAETYYGLTNLSLTFFSESTLFD